MAGPSGERARQTGSRSKARRAGIDLLFEAEQRGLNAGDLLAQRIAVPVTESPLRQYTCDLVSGVVAHWGTINELLSTYSQGWALDRMPAVDRAVLRQGVWEILWNDEVPDGVAVSEAVELVSALSTDQSPTFVNGLLSRIAEVKPTLALGVPAAPLAEPASAEGPSDEVPDDAYDEPVATTEPVVGSQDGA